MPVGTLSDQPPEGFQPLSDEPPEGFVPLEQAAAPAVQERGLGSSLLRQGGLTARAGLSGAGFLSDMATTAGKVMAKGGAAMFVPAPLQSAVQSLIERYTQAFPSLERGLTAAGLPEPENGMERVVYDVNRGAAAAATSAGLAGAAAPASVLAARPGMQMASGASAAAGSSLAREAGIGPVGQAVAGLAAGVVVPSAIDATRAIVSGGASATKAAVQPFREKGREKIVGQALRKTAADADAAASALDDIKEYIPGSSPTTAQASKDYGLLVTEKGLAASTPKAGAAFAERAAGNNEARRVLLEGMAKTKATITAAESGRKELIGPLYERAFAEFKGVPPKMLPKAQEIMSRLKGTQAVAKAQQLAQLQGVDLGDPSQSLKGMHYLKMALDDMIDSPVESGFGRTAIGALKDVRGDLIQSMQKMSPLYELAQGAWHQASRPIEQMKVLQDISKRTDLAARDVTGGAILSQAKWQNVVTDNLDDLSKTLSPEQLSTLRAIGKDLDRGALSQSAGKAVGSNTFQNYSTAHILGSALGTGVKNNPFLQTLTRPIAWLYKVPDEQIDELMVSAMLDPGMARSLMAKATPQRIESLGFELQQKARAMGIGLAVSQSAQQGKSERDKKQ